MDKYKKDLDNFIPMTKEEQKDLLFILLDCMDHYAEKLENAQRQVDKDEFYRFLETYRFLSGFFLKIPAIKEVVGQDHYEFCRNMARKARREWEEKKNEA